MSQNWAERFQTYVMPLCYLIFFLFEFVCLKMIDYKDVYIHNGSTKMILQVSNNVELIYAVDMI